MGIRTTTLIHEPAQGPASAAGQRRLAELLLQAAADLAAGRTLLPAFQEAATWPDRHRRYQARKQLAELALSYQGDEEAWIAAFASAARGLLAALEEEAAEPVLLNYAGVFLYELGGFAAAEKLFRAALRLDPSLPHAAANLAAARQRRRRGLVPPASARREVAALAARAASVAGRARPAEGLTLSLCMIVRDEEEMLPGCLDPVAPYVDEIVIVDTGSRDRTVEIAESYGARVLRFPWNGSFADARNVSLEAARGDWILYLDADEHMVAEDAPQLRELLGKTWREGFHLVETSYTGCDDGGPAVTHLALRLFRNRPEYRFQGRIHEQKTERMPTYLPERFETAPIRVLHYGYLKDRVSERDKSRRNIALLEQEEREAPSPFTAFNLGSEYARLGEAERARAYFERAWQELGASWQQVGYAAILVSRLASARRQTGDLAAARAAVEEGLRAFPDHTDLVLELALCARQEGELAEAERLARRCLAMGDAPAQYVATVGSGSYLALSLLADLRHEQGDVAEAEELYRRCLREHPAYLAPVLPLVSLLLARGASEQEVAAAVPSASPGAALLAAVAFLEAGRAREAEAWFRATLARQPANPVARIGLVEALLSQRRYREAAAEAALGEDTPLAAAAASARLFAYAVLGQDAELRRTLQQAAEAGVEEPELALYAAWTALLAGEELPDALPEAALPRALTVLEALLRVQELEAFAACLRLYERIEVEPRRKREELARLYLRRGFLDSAAEEWLAVARAEPDAACLVGLAQVAYARGLREEAATFVDGALALSPEHAGARALKGALARQEAAPVSAR